MQPPPGRCAGAKDCLRFACHNSNTLGCNLHSQGSLSLTCSAASEASVLGFIGPACGPSRSARPRPSPAGCSRATGPACPCTATSAPCPPPGCGRTGCRGPACCAAASRARTSASPGKARGSRGSVRACGPTWRAWSPSADRTGWWLRTFLASEAGARTGCSLSWRLRATPAGRSWWVLSMPGRRTAAPGCGWWRKPLLPTPVARDWKNGSVRQQRRRRACQLNDAVGGRLHPGFAEWMLGFPPGWSGCGVTASRRWEIPPPQQPSR